MRGKNFKLKKLLSPKQIKKQQQQQNQTPLFLSVPVQQMHSLTSHVWVFLHSRPRELKRKPDSRIHCLKGITHCGFFWNAKWFLLLQYLESWILISTREKKTMAELKLEKK